MFTDSITGLPWQALLKEAIEAYLHQTDVVKNTDAVHIEDTPTRVVRAYAEYVSGYNEDPKAPLLTTFKDSKYDEMVHCANIPVVSMCAHHALPIIGRVHFAYVPAGSVVGLSKIPRFIDILCRRFQIQENLTQQIADVFQETVKPGGCGVQMKALHCCMIARGVREHDEVTITTALRGGFKGNSETRQEFLRSLSFSKDIL